MLIFYVDETGDSAMTAVEASVPPELNPIHSSFFTLAAVGVHDSQRKPLAERMLQLKRTHFGDAVDGAWGDTEIKGRYLLHFARNAGARHPWNAPAGWTALTDRAKLDALIHDLALLLGQFRPTVLVNVVDKRRAVARGLAFNPIGIAYRYLQRNIALILENQYAGESGMIVADQQTEHEKLFRSGEMHEIRKALALELSREANFSLVLDKPLWVDTDLSTWDREIIQLADIASFLVTRVMEDDGMPPAELSPLWEALLPAFARHPVSGRILGRGIAMYPPRSSRLSL